MEKIKEGLQYAADGIEDLRREVYSRDKASGERYAHLEQRLTQISENLTELKKIVKDGNGKKPLTERVLVLEEWREQQKGEKVEKGEESKGKWAVVVAIVAAAASVISTLVSGVLALVAKHPAS